MDQAEGLRNIIKKAEMEAVPAKREARVITVTSGKGGVGKTSVSVNLAIQFSRMGKRVIVLDADFGLANIEVMLGLRPEYNLGDLIFRGKSVKEIIAYGPENIGFISGGSGISELANMNQDQIRLLTRQLEVLDEMADVIIVDTGAGIGNSVLEFVSASSEVLLVATPEPTSITDAYALLKSLNRNSTYIPEQTVVKLIANQIRNKREEEQLFQKLQMVIGKFLDIKVELVAMIPYDTMMPNAIMRQSPVSLSAPHSNVGRTFYALASRLEYGKEQVAEKQGIRKIFSKIIHMRMDKKG